MRNPTPSHTDKKGSQRYKTVHYIPILCQERGNDLSISGEGKYVVYKELQCTEKAALQQNDVGYMCWHAQLSKIFTIKASHNPT